MNRNYNKWERWQKIAYLDHSEKDLEKRANGEKRFLDFVTKIGNGTIRLPLGVPLY